MAVVLAAAAIAGAVDPSTLTGKYMLGYQGWFATPCDGMGIGWSHWTRGNRTPGPDPDRKGYLNFDSWPDMSAFDADELCPTDLVYEDGTRAGLYSNANPKTVLRHFQWMKAAGVDGVWKQRFVSDTKAGAHRDFNDKVTLNVQAGAEATGRVWGLMYDISGQTSDTVLEKMKADWAHVTSLNFTQGSSYIHHRGKPAISIWGLGFTTRDINASVAAQVLDFFDAQNVTVMGGVPTGWRTLTRDSKTDPAWAAIYRRFAIISPWTVGRYTSVGGVSTADKFLQEYIIPDVAEAKKAGADYLPVIFPGGSAHYEPRDPPQPFNRCPRDGGWFLWRQIYNAVTKGGVRMLYGAMFDEVSEGTAYYHIAAKKNAAPSNAPLLYNDIDAGVDVPSDWWLRLAGTATAALRSGSTLPEELPCCEGCKCPAPNTTMAK